MRRLPLALLALAAAAAPAGCRDHRVDLAFAPEPGDRFAYRYEVTATLTREVDGDEEVVEHVDAALDARQQVLGSAPEGTRVRLSLTREGGTRSTVVAVVDRAGSLAGIELVEGFDATVFGIGDPDGLVVDPAQVLPDRPLGAGDRWSVDEADRHGEGRLERFGVVDGHDVALVRTATVEPLAGDGEVRSTARTFYDVHDGAVREGRSRSVGELTARLDPPVGIVAEPVETTVRFVLEVRVTRTG